MMIKGKILRRYRCESQWSSFVQSKTTGESYCKEKASVQAFCKERLQKAVNMKVNIAEFWSLPGPMISTLLSELMPGPGTNKWGPDTRQTTPSIMVIPGINNLRAQLGGCIELSSHKTSVKCGHINTDTDQTTSGGMLKC